MPGRRNYSKVDYEVTLIKKFKNKGEKKGKAVISKRNFSLC